ESFRKMDELLMENQDHQEVIPLKKFKRYEQKTYKNSSHMVGAFQYLQSLSKDENSCDIRIETEDGTIIFGHKLVFMSISKYFREVCTVAHEKCLKNIFIRELNSNILLILINFIYTGEIIVTEGNAK
ncbi:kelch-like protein 20 isoform X1, partial [Aphis craccivora]